MRSSEDPTQPKINFKKNCRKDVGNENHHGNHDSNSSIFKIYLFYLYIFWLRWVFVAERGLSLFAVSGGYSSLWCAGFSCCGAWALGARASVVVTHRLSSFDSWALECRLSSCGAWA